ncbi:MAG TPA: hypothetical protein VHE23_07380 [Candidatus Acidoferrales bacterium]|jgi:hypothetical protein|nr:hypothetical protein [Candidatus Acidoferrales bacterium]
MPTDEETKAPNSGTGKKPYSKPAVQSEPIYETLALACGKTPGAGGRCIGGGVKKS